MAFKSVAWPKPNSFICVACETVVEPDANAYRGWRHVATESVNCRARDLAAHRDRLGIAKTDRSK